MIEATKVPDKAIYGRLIALDRKLKGEGVTNKNDRVLVLIVACITEGIDVGGLIVSVLVKLEFDKDHVRCLLRLEAKNAKADRLWFRDAKGRYCCNDA